MSWLTKHKELGRVKTGTTQVVRFKWEGEPLEVTKMESSCGCTKPEFNKASGELKANFKAGAIPKHLRTKGYYTTTKSIKVYTDKGDFKLTFKATIIK